MTNISFDNQNFATRKTYRRHINLKFVTLFPQCNKSSSKPAERCSRTLQQQKNAGLRSQLSTHKCRNYFVLSFKQKNTITTEILLI